MALSFIFAFLLLLSVASGFYDHTHGPGHFKHEHSNFNKRQTSSPVPTTPEEPRRPNKPKFKTKALGTSHIPEEFGKPFSMDCILKQPRKARVVWYKDGMPLKGHPDFIHFNWSRHGQFLTINKLEFKDAGNYTCVASWLNFKSKPAYRSYILEVIERQPWATPPLINKDHPGNHTVKVGTNLTLKCEIHRVDAANDAVRMKWVKHWPNDTKYEFNKPSDGQHKYDLLQDCSPLGECSFNNGRQKGIKETVWEYTLHNVHYKDTGWYSCVARNSHDLQKHQTGYVNVVDVLPEEMKFNAALTTFAIIASVVGLTLCLAFSYVVFKWRLQIKARKDAEDNARKVIKWTKRVIVEMDQTDQVSETSDIIRPSRVVIQRQPITRFEDDPETRATLSGHSSRCGLGSYTAGETVYSDVSDKGYSEYEFELDPKWEIDAHHIRLGKVLGEGEFGRVVQADICRGVICSPRQGFNVPSQDVVKVNNAGCVNSHSRRQVRLKPDEDRGFYYNLYSRSMLSLRRSNSNIALSKRHHNNNNDGDETAAAENLKSINEEDSSEWTSCAIKMLKEGHTDSELKDLVQEMTTMKQIGKHENVISLLGTCVRPGRGSPFYVIVELASKGSLKNYLKQARPPDYRSDYEPPNVTPNHGQFHPAFRGHCGSTKMTLKSMLAIGWQVSKGMEYLAMKRCLHRDLAARNVLVCGGQDCEVFKVADFGMARDVKEAEYYRKISEGKVPLKWMAPEAIFDRVYTYQSDVWSFGVLMWEVMSFGDSPFPNQLPEAFMENLRAGQVLARPYGCPQDAYSLMLKCWTMDPSKRPQWSTLVDKTRTLCAEYHPQGYLPIPART